MKTGLTTILLLFITLSIHAQWEQVGFTSFTRHHGIGFSIGEYGYILSGGSGNGSESTASRTFHRYNPKTNAWLKLDDYPGIARGYSIGSVWEDKLYFGFGTTSDFQNLNDLWEYDPANDSFTNLPTCPCVGRAHPAFVTMDGKIYVGMGNDDNGNLNDWWSYDIATKEWTQKASIPGRRHHPYQFVIDESIYVGSGHRADWHKYDAASDTWTQIADLDTRVAGTQFSFNGKGYALSGTNTSHNYLNTGEFWEYDPADNKWTELEPHPGASRWAPASFIIGDEVYFFGGYTDSSLDERTVWKYNLAGATTSVSNVDEDQLAVYPNPFIDHVRITSEEIKSDDIIDVEVFDLTGRLILQSKENANNIDLSQLQNGLYMLSARSEDKVLSTIISKQE